MSSMTDLSVVPSLSQLVEALGPISETAFDRSHGKRRHDRRAATLPVRLSLLGEIMNECVQTLAARSRDVSAAGLGLTVPTELPQGARVQVEVLSGEAAWTAVMQVAHCTQTIGGYKVGLDAMATPPGESAAGNVLPASVQPVEVPALEEAQAEAREALRQYQLAEATWGLFGTRMEREIKRIVETLPAPPPARRRLEPRRGHYRHEVETPVCVLIPSGTTHRLLVTRLVDLSLGGARLHVAPACAAGGLENAEQLALGILETENGTLWLPARLVHGSSPLFREKTVGLRFVAAMPRRPGRT